MGTYRLKVKITGAFPAALFATAWKDIYNLDITAATIEEIASHLSKTAESLTEELEAT